MNLNICDPDQSQVSLECAAHFWCSAVTVCPCGFPHCLGLEQKIDSNITLAATATATVQHTAVYHKHTRANCVDLTVRTFREADLASNASLCLCVTLTQFFVPLESSPYLILSFPVSTSCSFFPLTLPLLSFRVTWPPALASQVRMSTTPWCCTTTTAPAGRNRSSFPSRSTCFGGRMSGLSSDTAPVSRNWVFEVGSHCFGGGRAQ